MGDSIVGRQWGEHCAVRCVGDKSIKFTQPIESNRQVETTALHFFLWRWETPTPNGIIRLPSRGDADFD